jgi:hypothetical protein
MTESARPLLHGPRGIAGIADPLVAWEEPSEPLATGKVGGLPTGKDGASWASWNARLPRARGLWSSASETPVVLRRGLLSILIASAVVASCVRSLLRVVGACSFKTAVSSTRRAVLDA